MSLSLEEVRRIAELARLRLEPEEEEKLALQLSEIVDYIDQLAGFETAPPRASAVSLPEDADESRAGLPQEAWLDNAPASLSSFFLVPQVKSD